MANSDANKETPTPKVKPPAPAPSPHEQLMQAQRQLEAEAEAERQRAEEAYRNSPQGKLEAALMGKLPDYRATSIRERMKRGGFHGNSFEVEGLPANIKHTFWPRDQLHEARSIWKPIDPELVTSHESELANGKVLIRRPFEIVDGKVCTGRGTNDQVMLICSAQALSDKIGDSTANWNARFEKAAPTGRDKGRMQSEATGRNFQVDRERDGNASISRQLLRTEGDLNG